ncbi:MAG TPA: histidine kinase [Pseudonocardiaceae bacterium]|jgi:signal transduction histidine kinase|nr:histidine kinase [Pseudonocardiaceae bacterium]
MWSLRRARDGDRHGPVSTIGPVARFMAAGAVVLVSLAGLLALLARQAGTDDAVRAAAQTTAVTARGVVEPRLDTAVIDGDPAALAAFDAAMRRYVLQGSLVRVKLWNADDTIIYSDEPRLVGQRFPLNGQETAALNDEGSASEVSDLGRPENRFEIPYGKLLEVYVGIRSTSGQPLLFETYYKYDAVTSAGEAAWLRFAPPSLGALLVLELVQIPFAWGLARRIQRQQAEREGLLRHAVEASDVERRRIAGELHDGVVQELTGLTYALDAARLGQPDEARRTELITETATRLRASIGALRSLLMDIYPPNLAEEGLASALADLTDTLARHGIDVRLDAEGTERLSPDAAALLFRTAQEAVRNVIAHSGARAATISVAYGDDTATLVIDDDGRGFDDVELDERSTNGHVGLRSIGDLLARSGGGLSVRAAPGQGTRVEAEVPVR